MCANTLRACLVPLVFTSKPHVDQTCQSSLWVCPHQPSWQFGILPNHVFTFSTSLYLLCFLFPASFPISHLFISPTLCRRNDRKYRWFHPTILKGLFLSMATLLLFLEDAHGHLDLLHWSLRPVSHRSMRIASCVPYVCRHVFQCFICHLRTKSTYHCQNKQNEYVYSVSIICIPLCEPSLKAS